MLGERWRTALGYLFPPPKGECRLEAKAANQEDDRDSKAATLGVRRPSFFWLNNGVGIYPFRPDDELFFYRDIYSIPLHFEQNIDISLVCLASEFVMPVTLMGELSPLLFPENTVFLSPRV